jgi:uncharacterized SAM-binding protein YcdF (DUF218 family)
VIGHQIANLPVSPTFLLALLAALGALLLWTPRWHGGRALVCLAVLGFALIAVLPVEQWALRPLEDRFPAPQLPEHVDGIVVLGGAIEADLSADRGQPALNQFADRMTEFVTLARRYPEARLAFTGGPLPGQPDGPREADAARELLAGLGIDGPRMLFEDRSTTTWENAVFTQAAIQPRQGEIWLLVTSAMHLPRAVGAFRAVGWETIPIPVGYKTYRATRGHRAHGLVEKLELLREAAHEWVGLAYYWLGGRSTALFPAPRAVLPLPPPPPSPVTDTSQP